MLDQVFARHPNLRGYVLDEPGAIRHHLTIFVDGAAVRDKSALSTSLPPIYCVRFG